MTDRLLDEKAARAALGGLGRTAFYELIGAGAIGTVHIGRRLMVPESQIQAFIETRTTFAENGTPETIQEGGVCDVCGRWFKRPSQHRRMAHGDALRAGSAE